MRSATLLGLTLLLLAPHAGAVEKPTVEVGTTFDGDCPENPRACGTAYAQVTIEVGPLMVVAVLRVDDGNDKLEAYAEARPGDAGEVVFRVVEGSGNVSANATFNATIRIETANTTLEWPGATGETFAYDPSLGPASKAFPFRVPAGAPVGRADVPFVLVADNETKYASIGIEVVGPEESRTPGPGVVAVVAAALLLAGLRRRAP